MILICIDRLIGCVVGFYAYAAQNVRQTLPMVQLKTNQRVEEKEQLVRNLTIQNQLSGITQLHEAKPVYQRLFDYLKS